MKTSKIMFVSELLVRTIAILVLIAGLSLGRGEAAAQATTGTISGFVRDTGGHPLTGLSVVVAAEGNGTFRSTCSDASTGAYTIADVPLDTALMLTANSYYVDCIPSLNAYGWQYWENAPDEPRATPVTLTASSPTLEAADFNLEKYPSIEYLVFNFDSPILSDLAVRQAIAYGTDRQRIINEAKLPNGEYGVVPSALVNDNHWAKAPDSVLTLYPYDPAQARAILEGSGWVDADNDGIREKDGQRLSLKFDTTTRASRVATGNLFQQMMADIGMEIQTTFTSNPTFQQQILFPGLFDIATIAPGFCANSQDESCVPWDAFYTGSFRNYGNYSSAEADAEYQAALGATTREEKLPHAIQQQVIVSRDLPTLPLSTREFGTPPPAFTCAAVTDIPEAECEALRALYESTNGATWTNNAGWLQADMACSWYGVTCNAGHVSELYLPTNNLSGSLPTTEWADLPYMTELWLYENHLTGAIPTELGSLGNLIRLVLYSNQFKGSIPLELASLSQLRALMLFDNQLIGTIPLALTNVTSLRNLDLSYNQLSGSIPGELGSLANLKYLFLNDNQMTGSIPPELGQLQQLLNIGLGGNELTGSIPSELGGLTGLTSLGLGRNQLSGTIPPEFGNLTNLQSLNLRSNHFTGNIPSSFGNLSSLVDLRLDTNEMSGEIPSSIKNLIGLTSLSLSCGLTSNDQTVTDFIRARSPDWPSGSCRFLSGTVRDAAGNPITGTQIDITVALEDPEDPGLPSSDILEHVCTDSNTGHYTLTDLPQGQLLFVFAGDVQWCDPYNTYGREYWSHHNRPWLSDAITLTPGEPNRTGIDFTLGTGVPELEFLVFNFNIPILADPAVREAIAYGTDRQAIVSQAWLPYGDFGMVQNSYVGENHWAKAPDSVLTLHPYDPNRARSTLGFAGWIDTDGDGIREKNGQRLSLIFKTTLRQSRQDTGHLFKQWMADIGLEIQLDFMTSDDLYRQLAARDFDLAEWTGFNFCSNTQDETCVPFREFYSTAYGNVGSYNNPAADAELDAARAATSREERLVHAIQHQIIISEDLPILPLFRRRPVVGVDVPAGSNVNVTPMAGVTINFSEVTGSGVSGAIATGLNSGDLPGGLELLGGVYEVGTSAQFSTAQACLTYVDTGLTAEQESHLRLFHEVDGDWVDITDAGYPDTVNNQICGTVTSFSPFAVVLPPPNTPPGNVVVTTPIEPQAVGTSVQMSASFDDPDVGDTHTATWNWGDGTSNVAPVAGLVATASHTYSVPGVYTISVTITDGAGASASGASSYLVVYDPNGGFVTGGGWINSPAGAYAANPALTGKATFGFVSKYQKGANVPTGNTEFQFKVGNLNFSSTSYAWLVVAGAKAQYKGSGTINGGGAYSFMLTAIDGQVNGGGGVDKFRIKIWGSGGMVYDNQMGGGDNADPATAIQGGSIVVHK